MSDQTITSLIEKLEGAVGPSIATDAEICWTLERERAVSAFWRGAMGLPHPLPNEFSRLPRGLGMASLEAGSPNYTASLDAALALAERVLPGWVWEITILQDETSVQGAPEIWPEGLAAPDCGGVSISLRTPALALCAALLRAQSEARV